MKGQVLTDAIGEQVELLRLDANAVAIFCWRAEQLERAGYSSAVAHLLADDFDVDLHLACDLITRGCPERTAYAILA